MPFDRVWHRQYPQGVPTEIDFEHLTLPEMLSRSARRFPDRAALIYLGKSISYARLERLVGRCANALKSLGIGPGDTVAMHLPNIPQMVIASYAAYRLGAVTAMNNPLYTERELAYQLLDSDARAIVTLDLLLPRVLKVLEQTRLEQIIVCHINDYLPFPARQLFPYLKRTMFRRVEPHPQVISFLNLMRHPEGEPLKNRPAWDDLAVLMYTGGTTGQSKGVMLTHANLSCNVQQLRAWVPDLVDGEDSTLAIFPFFHAAGFTGIQNLSIYTGNTDILVPRPEPGMIIDLIRRYRPTILPGVPTIYVGLLNDERFRRLDLSCIKGFLAGAAPLALDTIKELKDLTGGGIVNVYGLSEISPMGTATPWKGRDRPGSVGVPLPDTDLRIVDVETGEREMPAGEPGEILFRGPQVMQGYYRKPEETAAVLCDGWIKTGDIGYLDEDGFLTLVDRKKDLIVASGYNIYPQEIDAVLFEHPKILEACTIGVPDNYRGETVKAYVVRKPGVTLEAPEVIDFCRTHLAAYKVPTSVIFIDALPKSAVGKILRRELRDLALKPAGS